MAKKSFGGFGKAAGKSLKLAPTDPDAVPSMKKAPKKGRTKSMGKTRC